MIRLISLQTNPKQVPLMNTIHRDIFKAIHEGKWLSIEYRNKQEETTKYWIGIRNLNITNRSLSADGLCFLQALFAGNCKKFL